MSNMNWVSLINDGLQSQTATGTALQNSVTLTDISAGGNNTGQALQFPGAFLIAGMQMRVRANGIVSNTGTPNLTLGLYWGGVAGVALAAVGPLATATGLSSNTWLLEALVRCETTGASGSARTIGSVLGPFGVGVPQMLPVTGGGAVTIDTSGGKVLTVGAQWGTASASNTITCLQFAVELMN